MCLRGVSEIHRQWLEPDPDAPVSVYVVWVPELDAERGDVAEAAALIPDPRARHYWDPGEELGRAFAEELVEGPVPPLWDVYFLYGPEAGWSGPVPDELRLWMQQLSYVQGLAPRLDAEAFADSARDLTRGLRREGADER